MATLDWQFCNLLSSSRENKCDNSSKSPSLRRSLSNWHDGGDRLAHDLLAHLALRSHAGRFLRYNHEWQKCCYSILRGRAARVHWRVLGGSEQQKISGTWRERVYKAKNIYRYAKGRKRRRTFYLSVKAVVRGCASNKQVCIMSRSPKVAAPGAQPVNLADLD